MRDDNDISSLPLALVGKGVRLDGEYLEPTPLQDGRAAAQRDQIGIGAIGCGCDRMFSTLASIHLVSKVTGSWLQTARIRAMRPRGLWRSILVAS